MHHKTAPVDYTKLQLIDEFSHPFGVTCFAISGNKLVIQKTGCNDEIHILPYKTEGFGKGQLALFNKDMRQLKFPFNALYALYNGRLVVGNADSISVYNYENDMFYFTHNTPFSIVAITVFVDDRIAFSTKRFINIVDPNNTVAAKRILVPTACQDKDTLVLAALGNNHLAIGFEKTIYILNSNTGNVEKNFNVPGNIQALTALDNNHLVVGYVECEFHGDVVSSESNIDEDTPDKNDVVKTCDRKFLNVATIYNVNSLKMVAELHWSLSYKIKFLITLPFGDGLIVGFNLANQGDCPDYYGERPGPKHTAFKVYKFIGS